MSIKILWTNRQGYRELICKRFYASVIAKELGLGNNNTTDTYNSINNSSIDTIINSNINDLKSQFGIDDVNIEHHCLPRMYWLPKMHKSPIKARFIIASPKSLIKPLSRAITSQLFVFFIDNDKCRFFSGVNTFWVVQNNKQITDAINKLNERNKANSISTFDFSTLYTKLPHNKLLMVLHHLIDFCFDEVKINSFKLINLEHVALERLTTIGYVLVNNK